MPDRRSLLLLPFAAALSAGAAQAAPWHHWRRDVTELRFAASGQDARPLARMLQDRLGVPVIAVRLQGMALAHAMDRGHVEFALLDRATLSAARARMHRRLVAEATPHHDHFRTARAVLSRAMRDDVFRALA